MRSGEGGQTLPALGGDKAGCSSPIKKNKTASSRRVKLTFADRPEADESVVPPSPVNVGNVCLCSAVTPRLFTCGMEHRSDDEADYEDEEVDPRIQVTG